MTTLPLFTSDFQKAHDSLIEAFHAAPHDEKVKLFSEIIWHNHAHNRRSFRWREEINPYFVVCSEIMLQQTQTDRVAPKFDLFVQTHPSFTALASASFEDVLRVWKGLGYNRRALNLQKIAQRVVHEFDGKLPSDPEILETFNGIGHATARSIAAFAFNAPTAFIETNIRTVFIYFFFKNEKDVTDKQLMPLIQASVSPDRAREWYYALMDYGVMLKKTVGNVSRLSAHYTKQSKFEGSDRQIRGMVLQVLLDHKAADYNQLPIIVNKEAARTHKIINQMIKEGLVKKLNDRLELA